MDFMRIHAYLASVFPYAVNAWKDAAKFHQKKREHGMYIEQTKMHFSVVQ